MNSFGKKYLLFFSIFLLCCVGVAAYSFYQKNAVLLAYAGIGAYDAPISSVPAGPPLDTAAYNAKLLFLSHGGASNVSTSTALTTTLASSTYTWPTKQPYPYDGDALLPFNRIVAYYGNFYSGALGVLGQYPPQEMLQHLQSEVEKWQAADPATHVIPAIDYIAVTAQGQPGPDGLYRARMPASQINEAISLADQVQGQVFLDLQVGWSDLQTETVLLDQYLQLPNVHLAIDPEFAMRPGDVPGKYIGTVDASQINDIISYLSQVVITHNLPPKILVLHRFTENMVTNANLIKPTPQVQVVMDMDGWGYQSEKIKTYYDVITTEPVQFTGIKLFYKNDLLPPSTGMLSTAQVLKLLPSPSYIQYQ